MTDTPRPPMTQPEPVLGYAVRSTYREWAEDATEGGYSTTTIAPADLIALLDATAQTPVQPVLSGLDRLSEALKGAVIVYEDGHAEPSGALLRRLATAPAAKTPPDPFDPDQRYLEDRTAPAADEGPDR